MNNHYASVGRASTDPNFTSLAQSGARYYGDSIGLHPWNETR